MFDVPQRLCLLDIDNEPVLPSDGTRGAGVTFA
jgi:hypothetical protein